MPSFRLSGQIFQKYYGLMLSSMLVMSTAIMVASCNRAYIFDERSTQALDGISTILDSYTMAISSSGRVIAKIFWNGRSQAVRLPREFRFDTNEVLVWREGGRIILEPAKKRAWPLGYFEALDALDPLDESVVPPAPLPASPSRDKGLDAWHRDETIPSD